MSTSMAILWTPVAIIMSSEWKSERMTDVDGVGVKEAFASKNKIIHKRKAIVMKIEHFELNLFLQDSEKNIDIGSTQADP